MCHSRMMIFQAYGGRFDGFPALPASVSKTCLVRVDNNKYWMNAIAVGRPVDVRAYVVRQDVRVVAEHKEPAARHCVSHSMATPVARPPMDYRSKPPPRGDFGRRQGSIFNAG